MKHCSSTERLEDLRDRWIDSCATRVDQFVQRHRETAATVAGLDEDGPSPELGRQVRDWAAAELVPHCVEWLSEGGNWSGSRDDVVVDELLASLQNLPDVEPYAAPVVMGIPATSWMAAAAAGAFVGSLLLTPLSLLVVGAREPGLLLGAVLGSAVFVFLLDRLSRSRRLRIGTAVLVSGGFLASLGSLKAGSAGGLARRAGILLVALLAFLARPRRHVADRAAEIERLEDRLRPHLRHVADLVLAWCWAHPDRGRVEDDPEPAGPPLPALVLDTLGQLKRLLVLPGANEAEIRDLTEGLLQRFEEEGYHWKFVEDGRPYEESLGRDFRPFGKSPAPGTPVRTLKPAVLRDDKLLDRGLLQTIRVTDRIRRIGRGSIEAHS